MTQRLIIPRIEDTPHSASDIPLLLHRHQICYTEIKQVNWPQQYPYCPRVAFAAAHTGDALLLHYMVEEQSVRATCQADGEHVWEDSCVEFFIKPSADDDTYYNVECNCTGLLLLAAGAGRCGRRPAPPQQTQAVWRWASLGSQPFGTRLEPAKWELALRVPATVFFEHNISSFDGLQATGNAYKCGDNLPQPHFVSWSPIATEKPDFHRPEYFAPILFA